MSFEKFTPLDESDYKRFTKTAFFHDKKSDWYFKNKKRADRGEGYEEWMRYMKEHKTQEKETRNNVVIFESTLNKIKFLSLIPNSRKNKEQIKLLEKRKEQANKLLHQVLLDVKKYIGAIENVGNIKITDGNANLLVESDKLRTIAHNALISSITAAMRFISFTFGEISASAREKYEEELEKRGEFPLEIERIRFPKNIFCPDYIVLSERKSITEWAFQIYSELSLLEKNFQK